MEIPRIIMAVKTILPTKLVFFPIRNLLKLDLVKLKYYALLGFQKCLEKMMKNVVSSRRPAIIVNAKTRVLKLEYMLKFCVGPTDDNPGPTLLRHESVAVKLVTKS